MTMYKKPGCLQAIDDITLESGNIGGGCKCWCRTEPFRTNPDGLPAITVDEFRHYLLKSVGGIGGTSFGFPGGEEFRFDYELGDASSLADCVNTCRGKGLVLDKCV